MARTLIRYSQVRRTEPESGANDLDFAKGRAYEADCLAADVAGKFVYVTGPEVAGIPQVSTVDITNPAKMPSVGMIVAKTTATRCTVQTVGETSLFVTVPGGRYFIDVAGVATNSPPTPVTGEIFQQLIGVGLESSRLLLNFNGQLVNLKS